MPLKLSLRKIFRYLLLTLVYLLLIALLLELGLRWLMKDRYQPPGQDSPRIWQYHPRYGWAGKPDIDVLFRKQAFSVRVQHNSLGFRDKDYPSQRNNKKRMLVLGDSFVWCFGVEQHDCFVDQLEARYPNWEIINAGLAGSGTDQQYLILQDLITYYQPDRIMLLVIQNDFQDNLAKENHFYYKPFYTLEAGKLMAHQIPVPLSRIDQILERWVYGRSYLFGIGGLARLVILNHVRPLLGMEPLRFEPYRDLNFRDGAVITSAIIGRMIELSRDHKADFILLHGQMLDFLRLSLEQTGKQYRVPVHNLDQAFEGYTHKQYQITGDAHWNALGHKLVTEDIDRFLRQQVMVKQP
jgi:hypothetical protein